MSDITVSIQLDSKQANAYLKFLINQYEQAMAACWYSDQYRHTPEGLRGRKVLADHPHIAGISRTASELKKQLREQGVQA